MNRRVLLISNMYPSKGMPQYGVFVKNFKENLAKEGFEVKVSAIKGKGTSRLQKIIKYVKFVFASINSILMCDYDLIYVHYISHSLIPFLFIMRKIKKPLIVNAHGSDVSSNSKTNRLIQYLVKGIIGNADLVVVPSKYYKNVIRSLFSIDEKNIFISPSGGINMNRFSYREMKKTKKFIIGYVSRIDKGKGWDVLLKAINIVASSVNNFEVILIGGGKQDKYLLNMINDYELTDKIIVKGSLSQKELVSYYLQMDVFVFPTLLPESLGLVGLEAMACGVPVIGSKIGGLEGYIKPGYNGTLFEPGNYKELADRILEFVSMNNSQLSQYKRNAINMAHKYDSNKVAKELSDKLHEIVK